MSDERRAVAAAGAVALRQVALYGRPGCHLCDDAREILLRVQAEAPFTLTEHDIERDDALFKAYLERIPVVTIDGDEAFEFFVDEDELRRRLAGTRAKASRQASVRDRDPSR